MDYPGFGLSSARPGYSFKPREHSTIVERFVQALNGAKHYVQEDAPDEICDELFTFYG
jgi:hypothetical protein